MRLGRYKGRDDLPNTIPVFPLAGALLLPHWQLQLNIFEPRYLGMVDAALSGARLIGMIQPAKSGGEQRALAQTGCVGRITGYRETPDNRYEISLAGVCRFEVDYELETANQFRTICPRYDRYLGDLVATEAADMPDRDALMDVLKAYVKANAMQISWQAILEADTETVVNALACGVRFMEAEKQALLEAPDLKARADILIALLKMDMSGGDSGNLQ
ncbi:MAG: LON peptidase substrate-binding domain-containing protein [Hyphomonas sp.]